MRHTFNQPSGAGSTEAVDVMIVGSGFGGAVAALRLTSAGIGAVLLERGRRWPLRSADTFSTLQNPDGRSAWLSNTAILGEPKPIDRYLGVLELVPGNGMAAFMGAGYGGGSLVYAAVLYQPSYRLFENVFGRSVSYASMAERYYPRAVEVLSPSPVPPHILHRPEYAGARAWLELGRRAHLPTRCLDLGLDWSVVAGELDGSLPRSVVAGEFWYGNNSAAKLSLDRNYLARAEATGLLEVVTQTEVVAIAEGPDDRYVVTANELTDDGTVRAQRRFVVKSLFLAAGANGTSTLMVRAKARGWLPRLSEQVGRHWGNNGDFFSAVSGLNGEVLPNLGGTAPVVIEDHDNPIAPVAVECFADWSTEGQQGMCASVGMAAPPAKGVFSYDPASDDVVLTWPADDPEVTRILQAGADTYRRLVRDGETCQHVQHRTYGVRVHSKSLAKQKGQLSGGEAGPISSAVTAHGLGGVVLGAATDSIGTLKRYRGLYAIDGSLVPGNTGCTNPALTITALAERNIEKIIERDLVKCR